MIVTIVFKNATYPYNRLMFKDIDEVQVCKPTPLMLILKQVRKELGATVDVFETSTKDVIYEIQEDQP